MILKEEFLNLDLEGLKKFCKDVSINLKKGDIICLSGDLGSGKTTFTRYLINSIYQNQSKEPPNIIKSPSFPILLTYELSNLDLNLNIKSFTPYLTILIAFLLVSKIPTLSLKKISTFFFFFFVFHL